jgi:outer membrane receptor protein involved in Fe transport
MKKSIAIYLTLLFAITCTAFAQQGTPVIFKIKGQVMDSTHNESVPYATLKVVRANNPHKAVTLLACDANGKFEAEVKGAGAYLLSIHSIGMAPTSKPFTLKPEKKTINFGKLYLHEDAKKLKEVTITAQKPLVKVEIDKITYNINDDPESVTNTTLDMMRKVPMITVDGDDKIQLKGSSNFKIYLNGKPSNLITNNPGDVLKSMPANTVKNIEVITDPGAKYDAEGIGGIINITTKSALQGYTGTVRANANNLGSASGGTYLSAKIGKFGITGNYNYSYRNSPYTDSDSYRENLKHEEMKYLTQNGKSKRKGPMQYGYLEASYEIDSLNLISLSANRFDGKQTHSSETNELMKDGALDPVYEFNRNASSKMNFGGTEVNLDYQHSTMLKNELLTVSYKYNQSPNNSENNTSIDNILDSPLNHIDHTNDWTKNRASTAEHTAQVDYTRPLGKANTIEGGVKYINRNSSSKTERLLDSVPSFEKNRNFEHLQHIYSTYASYSLKLKKFGFKAGVRAEGTKLAVTSDDSFKADYFDLVPSTAFSYQLSPARNLRLGYNMRIQRPGIWYLNPYVNNVDPLNISFGNPNLDSEKSHNVNVNFGSFSRKFNFNASLSYSYIANAIERYTYLDPTNEQISISTYDNIGKNQSVGLNIYGSWNPFKAFRITMNGGVDYRNMKSENYGTNEGFNTRIFTNAQYTLPKDFRIDLRGGYFAPRIMLQGKSSAFFFTGITLNKDFLKKKLTVSVSAQDPFWKTKKMESTTQDDNFYRNSVSHMIGQSFNISVSYRFGDMKSAIKKVRRGISNDDVKGGGDNNAAGGQGS